MLREQRSAPAIGRWLPIVALLLLAWGLRLCRLSEVPPGWRDDELINIHALSGEVLAGRFPLYFTGASGHEPLYHYLHAGVHAILGFNVLSGHLLSVALGTLTVALTYVLAHRLFGRLVAFTAALMLATSFWSLMYSRTAIRHISLPPFALLSFYVLWRSVERRSNALNHASLGSRLSFKAWHYAVPGLVIGASLYTYPAARLLLALPVALGAHLALFQRDQFRRHWRGLLLVLGVAVVLAAPLGVAIARGSSEAAVEGVGADARLAELAVPLYELRSGNPQPLLSNVWATLGMFHATGDPEWLYNIPDRPVYNVIGGILMWGGVALCLWRVRRRRYFLLLYGLGAGLLPAFVSVPPASLSHTVLAQPVVYVLPGLLLSEVRTRFSSLKLPLRYLLLVTGTIALLVFVASNAYRDLRDYFRVWPQRGMVRFLYRAVYRDAAGYLSENRGVTDLAIASHLMGPWDRLALEVDTQRDGVAVRAFDAERALLYPAGDGSQLIVPAGYPVHPLVQEAVADDTRSLDGAYPRFRLFSFEQPHGWWVSQTPGWISSADARCFGNGLTLLGTGWPEGVPAAGRTAWLLTAWEVSEALDLPPIPIVANPPPPGVYSGLRLAVFAHLVTAGGTFVAGDDGLWVDPVTLQPGDRFFQLHQMALPPDAQRSAYRLNVGLYDPMTGERWPIAGADGRAISDHLVIPVGQSP